MLDVEKFLIALRSNKDLDGKLKPIYLADTVQEEIKIIQAAVENSRREWVGLTEKEWYAATGIPRNATLPMHMLKGIEKALKERNG